MTEKGRNLPLIKQKNLSLIKRTIYRHSPISRSEIAARLSLTSPTITTGVNPMIAQGLLRELSPAGTEAEDSRPLGRRPVMLEFVPEAYYFCGVELGPYQIAYALTDLMGKTVSSSVGPYDGTGSYESTLAMLTDSIPYFIASANIPSERVLGVGVVMPGLIDGEAGKINSTFRPGWEGHYLSADLSERIGIPVRIDNNVRARIIEEDLFSRTRLGDPAAYFYVCYGVACHLLINGSVLYGQFASAGEIGHTVVERNGPMCATCGGYGCLEAMASERAILIRCRAVLYNSGASTVLHELCPGPEKLNISHVLEAQRLGDRAVEHIVRECVGYLAGALSSIVDLVSPRTVLIDGKIFSLESNRACLLSEVDRRTLNAAGRSIEFTFLPYDTFRGARGGAAIAVERFLLDNPSIG